MGEIPSVTMSAEWGEPFPRYVLDGHRPVPEPDGLRWVQWILTHQDLRVVAWTRQGQSSISTRFLDGLHKIQDGQEGFFETRITGGCLDGLTQLYRTWEAAEWGHWFCVRLVLDADEVLRRKRPKMLKT